MDEQNILKRTIADNLIFYRKQKGLTQLDIAEKFNPIDVYRSKKESKAIRKYEKRNLGFAGAKYNITE